MKGLGSDIIEIDRIKKSIDEHGQRFLDRLFTTNEQAYCNKHKMAERHYAARFAAKEAIVKAFGTGFREGITWLDIEIVHDNQGKPEVVLSDRLMERFESPKILLTMSHCKEYATATAVWLASRRFLPG